MDTQTGENRTQGDLDMRADAGSDTGDGTLDTVGASLTPDAGGLTVDSDDMADGGDLSGGVSDALASDLSAREGDMDMADDAAGDLSTDVGDAGDIDTGSPSSAAIAM